MKAPGRSEPQPGAAARRVMCGRTTTLCGSPKSSSPGPVGSAGGERDFCADSRGDAVERADREVVGEPAGDVGPALVIEHNGERRGQAFAGNEVEPAGERVKRVRAAHIPSVRPSGTVRASSRQSRGRPTGSIPADRAGARRHPGPQPLEVVEALAGGGVTDAGRALTAPTDHVLTGSRSQLVGVEAAAVLFTQFGAGRSHAGDRTGVA